MALSTFFTSLSIPNLHAHRVQSVIALHVVSEPRILRSHRRQRQDCNAMSSGLTLLRQLQARQKLDPKACGDVGDRQKKYHASEAETPDDDSTVGPSSTTSTRTARSAKEEHITIEVCLGPDCAVAGEGAALLEIEDLIRFSASSEKEISIVSGGCRDHSITFYCERHL